MNLAFRMNSELLKLSISGELDNTAYCSLPGTNAIYPKLRNVVIDRHLNAYEKSS